MPRRKRESVPVGQPVPVELVPVLEGEPLHVRWLGPVKGLLTHWGAKAPIGCPGERLCPATIHRGRTIWKGYAPGEYYRPPPYGDWAPGVIEVTARLMECLTDIDLRGTVWRCERQPGRGGRPEVVGQQIGEVNAELLREPFPVEPTVYRIYGTVNVLLGVEPYLPPRQILLPAAGPPPAVVPGTERTEAESKREIRARIKAQLLEGTLPAATRRGLPGLVAQIEREIAKERSGATQVAEEARPVPTAPPGPAPSPNGRHS